MMSTEASCSASLHLFFSLNSPLM
uniref:Uncharacterized protein n=1 Tax=Rhizophora mucronata TaxID=61149 RepID=A0A2P2QDE5_RHIMU